MPRIRTVKPEFFQDEKLAPLAPIDRLVFLGLISMADDAGRLLDNVKVIDAFIFPESDDSSATSLRTLADASRIIRYTSPSGQKLIQIRNWERHQKVEKPNRHVLPAPSAEDVERQPVTPPPDESGNDRGTVGEESPTPPRYDLGPTTNDLRPTTIPAATGAADAEGGGEPPRPPKRSRSRSAAVQSPADEGASRETWLTPALEAWERHKGPGSFRVKQAAGLFASLHKAGLSPEEIGRRLDRYCELRKGKFCTLADFAANHGEFIPPDPSTLYENGWMSAELERETRPPAVGARP